MSPISFGAVLVLFASLFLPECAFAASGIGDKLSISVTNKSGDIFSSVSVANIMPDGLLLENRSGQVKVRFEDLPADLRAKYEPLAAAARQKQMRVAQANAAYLASQKDVEAAREQVRLDRKKEAEAKQAQMALLEPLAVEVPNEGWKIVIPNQGFGKLHTQSESGQFTCRGQTKDGFIISVFVESPQGKGGTKNEDVHAYYWPRASRNPLIEEKSIKTEQKNKFVKVSYTTLDIPNVNFYFSYKGRWVDVHISKTGFTKEDEKRFADFESILSYGG
ncbi:MAG TPA: hypothetical protein VMZ27_01760 [Candidatus Saccharimonadales bacterium]|nr:hypothetical protein [Candidatus Saccharimonadales bacterium]